MTSIMKIIFNLKPSNLYMKMQESQPTSSELGAIKGSITGRENCKKSITITQKADAVLYECLRNHQLLSEGEKYSNKEMGAMNLWDILRHSSPRLYKSGIIFECGSRWCRTLQDLSVKIERILEDYTEHSKVIEGEENSYNKMYAIQIKEKHGTLRFYMSCETQEISELIHEIETLLLQMHEVCGVCVKRRGKTWLEVKCDKCYMEKQ